MKKYRGEREVQSAEGSQEFEVVATNAEEALEKYMNGEGRLVESDVEVIALSDFIMDSIYEVED
jgi:hypothetical protein